ncbi:MAG: 1,4-alpha-glucan branching protein GlgB, partial [Chitinophagaceae bacterium]
MAYEDEHFIDTSSLVWNYSFFTAEEVEKFKDGRLFTAYEKFGSHELRLSGTDGFYFSVWAPNAQAVSVIGEFNGWKPGVHSLFVRLDKSGIWEGFLPRIEKGSLYKFHITGYNGSMHEKADPFA